MLRARELIAAIALTAIFAGSARSEPAAATQPALAFTAQTVAPAKRQGAVNVAGGTWRCQGATCSRTGPQALLSVDACKALAHEVGAIRSYGYPAKRLDAGELSKCNEGLAAAAPAPAQQALFTAQTVAPARRQGAVNVPGGVWRCQASSCTRTGPETLLSVDVCKDLARQVGALNAYSRPGKSSHGRRAGQVQRRSGGRRPGAGAAGGVHRPDGGAGPAARRGQCSGRRVAMPAVDLHPHRSRNPPERRCLQGPGQGGRRPQLLQLSGPQAQPRGLE